MGWMTDDLVPVPKARTVPLCICTGAFSKMYIHVTRLLCVYAMTALSIHDACCYMKQSHVIIEIRTTKTKKSGRRVDEATIMDIRPEREVERSRS